ncbi:MAG: AMP-dependent synthetase and ligase [Proteobacteria bacterium]|nr:AMP-dependent synthetase and ligase [Pseudomonadota bacterium]
MTTLPLLPDLPAHQIVAFRQGQAINRAVFLHDVLGLAQRLPADRPLLNLCQDRYLFALGLFAGIVRGNLSLLPNSTAPESLHALQAQHPDLLCLHDHADVPSGFELLRVEPRPPMPSPTLPPMPQIAADQPVALVFTSGSTGTPQPHIKRFGRLVNITRAGAARIWAETGGPCAVLGTVPFQHMYGLESSVLLPLLGGGILCAERPYFPADVAAALEALPTPRFLVTTPFHLRNLLEAQIPIPPLAALVSATAPLTRELALQAERQLDAPVLEIYGSTETGQMATRIPTRTEQWTLFPEISLIREGETTIASGAYTEQDIVLGDVLELLDAQHFHLLGRGADMINIAGKRSSLAFLNNVILRLPGVRDAAFCLPHDGEASRLAAFVVAPGVTAREIQQGLRAYVDAVFLPRPIIFVDSLPRNATGKIPAAALAGLIATHLDAGA